MKNAITARLCGALFSDGNPYKNTKNHYYEVGFSLGEISDVRAMQHDLQLLGFKSRVSEHDNTITIGGRTFNLHAFRVKCASKSLLELMASLGVPVGNKSDMCYELPEWIITGSREIKREFLAGYLGGDGPKVTIRSVKRAKKREYNSIHINDIELYKRKSLLENGLRFGRQLAFLLSQFGVRTRRVFAKGDFLRKDGGRSTSIHIKLANDVDSALEYCKIGFAYCKQKTYATLPVKEFLIKIQSFRKEWQAKHAAALNLYNKGHSVKEIADALNMSYDTAFGWLRYNKRPTIGYHHLKFNRQVEQNA
jgi:hypothetical protein